MLPISLRNVSISSSFSFFRKTWARCDYIINFSYAARKLLFEHTYLSRRFNTLPPVPWKLFKLTWINNYSIKHFLSVALVGEADGSWGLEFWWDLQDSEGNVASMIDGGRILAVWRSWYLGFLRVIENLSMINNWRLSVSYNLWSLWIFPVFPFFVSEYRSLCPAYDLWWKYIHQVLVGIRSPRMLFD